MVTPPLCGLTEPDQPPVQTASRHRQQPPSPAISEDDRGHPLPKPPTKLQLFLPAYLLKYLTPNLIPAKVAYKSDSCMAGFWPSPSISICRSGPVVTCLTPNPLARHLCTVLLCTLGNPEQKAVLWSRRAEDACTCLPAALPAAWFCLTLTTKTAYSPDHEPTVTRQRSTDRSRPPLLSRRERQSLPTVPALLPEQPPTETPIPVVGFRAQADRPLFSYLLPTSYLVHSHPSW